MYALRLNNQDKSITLKRVSRSVVLRQVGRSGPQGPSGPAGPQGDPGEGVPTGGTAGQILTKDSGTDFDTSWQDPSATGGQVNSVVAGTGINVDSSDPINPEVALNAASQSSLLLADSAVQPGDLAIVATTGDYTDLTNTPAIPDTPDDIGALAIANNLSDLPDKALARTNLGLGSGDSVTFRTVTPSANLTYNLGSTSAYYSNLYAQRLNLNSTAYIDGATAGIAKLTGSLYATGQVWGDTGFKFGANASGGTDPLPGYISGVSAYTNGVVFGIKANASQTQDLTRWLTSAGATLVKIEADGDFVTTRDVEITDSSLGLILKSPDETRYRVTVANGGTLSVSAV